MTSIFSFSARTLRGDDLALSCYQGQVVLVVNVASECGFTPQYQGLEALYRDYRERGFTILGFPCDQFRHQEPGSAEEIARFCQSQYQISFPMFDKVAVNGPQAHPLFSWLKDEKAGVLGTRNIKWNFTKFLLSRSGQVLERYGSTTKPHTLRGDIERALAEAQAGFPDNDIKDQHD